MNFRRSSQFWVILFAIAALALYLVKYQVQDVKKEVVAAEHKLKDEREALHILEAEWAYLNRPERLRMLSDKYLQLVPLSGERVVELSALPQRGDVATGTVPTAATPLPWHAPGGEE